MRSSAGNSINSLRRAIEKADSAIEGLETELGCADPVEFCEKILHVTPTSYQKAVLLDPGRFLCLRWSRQSGKTVVASALMLWTATTKPGSYIAVVAPSLRQSKMVLRRIGEFAKRLPRGRVKQIQKMRVELVNGSIIEAFPNNPATIRGPSLNFVYLDEMGFIRDDKELYDAVLFTISTTGGRVVVSSTPGSRDSLFFEMCNDPSFSRSHVTWRDALEPGGPLKKEVLEAIQKQFEGDTWRWQREMEADFAEDEECFFPLKLITSVTDQSLSYWDIVEKVEGKRLYAGVDFGKHHDHSVVAVVMYDPDTKTAPLVHLKHFPLETEYDAVIGYIKGLTERWGEVMKITTDATGVGDVITSNMRKIGIEHVWDVSLDVQSKTDVLENLRSMMVKKEVRLVYDRKLIAEMNCEKFELSKIGQLLFSHPSGTHDDRLWAVALAYHGLRYALSIPTYHPVATTGRDPNSYFPNLPRHIWKK